MQQAMSEVGSTPLLALLLAYQPIEVPLQQQAAAAAASADGNNPQQQQQQEEDKVAQLGAKPVLQLPFDAAAVINSEELQWVCVDSNKPVSVLAHRGKGRGGVLKNPVSKAWQLQPMCVRQAVPHLQGLSRVLPVRLFPYITCVHALLGPP